MRPDQVPGLHRAEGRHLGQHPRRPGYRRQDGRPADRPVRLARGRARARRRALAGAAQEHHRARRAGARSRSGSRRCGATSTSTCDPSELVLAPPDRSQLPRDLPPLRVPRPARPAWTARRGGARRPSASSVEGISVPWREGELPEPRGRVGYAVGEDRAALADRRRSRDRRTAAGAAWRASSSSTTRSRSTRASPRRHADRRLSDRARAGPRTSWTSSAPSTASSSTPEPATDEETAALVRRAELPRRLAPTMRDRLAERGALDALRARRAAADRRARGDGVRGRQDRHVPHGRDHRPARRPGRGARGEGLRARRRGVHARLDAAGGAHPLREAGADARAQRQDGLLDRHARAALDPLRAPDRRGDRGVARADEARQHVPRPAARPDRRGRAPPHDHQPDRRVDRPALDHEPEPAVDPDPDRARPRDPLARSWPSEGRRLLSADYSQVELRILAHVSGEPVLREAFERGEDIHRATAAEVLGASRRA